MTFKTERRFLSHGDKNTKLRKSNSQSNFNFTTYGLSLAPSRSAGTGHNVCKNASKGCILACIFLSGNGRYSTVREGRKRKTKMFFEDLPQFEHNLREGLRSAQRKAKKEKKRVAVRLNMYSDIEFEKEIPWIFTDPEFSDITFYDYTKLHTRMKRFCAGEFPENYHLTFSRSENNERETLDILKQGGNAAIVLAKELYHTVTENEKSTWHGFEILPGDKTDLRFLEGKKSAVIALYAKGKGRSDTTGFVIRADGDLAARFHWVVAGMLQ